MRSLCLPCLILLAAVPSVAAQPPSRVAVDGQRQGVPVRFTEARQHSIRRSIKLTGTVAAARTAIVAAEVAGVVAQLPANEGKKFRRGEALAQLRREPFELELEAAKGQLAEAKARLKAASLRLDRLRELSDVVSQQDVDEAAYEAEALAGRLRQLEAEASRLEHDLKRTVVRAPFSGVVARELTQMGEWLAVGDPVVELLGLDSLEIRLEVPEQYFGQLRAGDPVTARFEALPDVEIEGTLDSIVPRADPHARTFPVIIELQPGRHALAAGMLADVDLPIGTAYAATLIPKDALMTRGELRFVYVVDEHDLAQRIDVETNGGLGSWIAVEGLEVGTRVITRGNERLRPDQPIAAVRQEYPPP